MVSETNRLTNWSEGQIPESAPPAGFNDPDPSLGLEFPVVEIPKTEEDAKIDAILSGSDSAFSMVTSSSDTSGSSFDDHFASDGMDFDSHFPSDGGTEIFD